LNLRQVCYQLVKVKVEFNLVALPEGILDVLKGSKALESAGNHNSELGG